MTTDRRPAVTPLEEPAAMTDTRTPTERRGYPLPPWALEGRYPHGEELLAWLELLLADTAEDRRPQAVAYLDDVTRRRADAQDAASRCTVEGHVETRADLAEARGRANELERTVARQAEAYRALEELYVATHRPAVQIVTELDDDEERLEVLTVTLAFDRITTDDLDDDARGRIAEAAAVRAAQAYAAERGRAIPGLSTARMAVDQAREDADRGRC